VRAVADDLRRAVAAGLPVLRALDDAASTRPLAPGKWCPRELVGHLIDSASNNHGRFVRAPFQDELVFAPYDQDAWVAAQRYREAPWAELVELWRLLNLHLARVFEGIDAERARRPYARHNLDRIAWRTVPADTPATIAGFAADYVGHLRHHLAALGASGPQDGAASTPGGG
jgi:hypothetical protein